MITEVFGEAGGNEYVPGTGTTGDTFDSLNKREICMLVNDVYYYLNHVFIMTERIGYRLVVIHDGQVRTNKCYAELRHAKIAFARMYNRKAWKKGVKAEWTYPYKPDSLWLDEKIKMLKKQVSI